MNIAKPSNGFRIVVSPAVTALLDNLLPLHPELPKHWKAVIERLKEAGHITGEAVDGNQSQRVAVIQPYYNGPLFKLAWRVVGDSLQLLAADF